MPLLLYSLSLIAFFLTSIAYNKDISHCTNLDSVHNVTDRDGDSCINYKKSYCGGYYDTCNHDSYIFDSRKCCGCQEDLNKKCVDTYTHKDSFGDGCEKYKKTNGTKSQFCRRFDVCETFEFKASRDCCVCSGG